MGCDCFRSLFNNQVLLGIITHCTPLPSLHSPKRSSWTLQFVQGENRPKNLFKRRVYWLVLKTARLFPIPTGLSGKIMVNILLMVNITPISYVRDKSVLAPSKKGLPSLLSLDKREYSGTHLKNEFTDLF